jgi:hypothetical protein
MGMGIDWCGSSGSYRGRLLTGIFLLQVWLSAYDRRHFRVMMANR